MVLRFPISWSVRAIAALILIVACLRENSEAQNPAAFVPVILEQEPAPGIVTSITAPQIRIKFDDGGKQIDREKILVEVDRNDVTAFVQLTEGTLQYIPASALQAGQHEVRITGTTSDGRRIQEIIWNFTIQEAPKNFTFGIEPTGTIEYKVRTETPNADPHRFNSNIAIRNQSTGRFQTSFTSNLQAQNPNPSQIPSDFDLANFQAVLSHGNSSVSLGDVLVNFDMLGVANLARRGLYFQQKVPFRSAGFDIFSVRSESILGFRHGFGISDAEQRVDGGSFFIAPTGKSENLNMRFYYLRGENEREQGFNFGGVTRGSKGNAAGVYITTAGWSNQVRVEANTGWSDFDFNASDDTEGNQDRALQLKFIFDPAQKMWKNRSSKFLAQLEIQDLGTFFKTLGNPFLVSDRRGFNLNSTWTYGQVTFTGGVSKFHDNVKALELIPTVDSQAYTAGFSYMPISAEGPPRWPSVSFTASRNEQQSKRDAVSFLAIRNVVDTFAGLASLNQTKWSLNLNTSYSINRDLNNRIPDTDAKNITLAALFMPAPFFNIGPSISFIQQGNLDTDIHTDLWTYSFTGSIPIQPERFTLDSQLSFSSTDSSDELNLNSNFSGTAQLSYHLHNLFKKKGRQTVAVRASYNRIVVDAPLPSRQKGFEIFVLLDLGWPIER